MAPDIAHWERDVFGESPGPIDADALGVRTEMTPARQTVAAAPADHVPFAADDLAGWKSFTFEPTATISPTNSCPIAMGTGTVARAQSSHL